MLPKTPPWQSAAKWSGIRKYPLGRVVGNLGGTRIRHKGTANPRRRYQAISVRVALRGCSDTVELRRSDDQWLNDSGDAVEFDVLLPGTAAAEFYAQLSPMASTARN